MPTLPVSKDVFDRAEMPPPRDPDKVRLRDIIEWYKIQMRSDPGRVYTGQELELLNARFVEYISAVAKREGVPAGMLAYVVQQLAMQEVQLVETAELEASLAISVEDE